MVLHISKADLGDAKDHPIIKPTDFVKAMDKHRRLDLLLPAADIELSKPMLVEYWRRFADQFGSSHEIFEKVARQDLALTIPCKLHGDEGRSSLMIFFGGARCYDKFYPLSGNDARGNI